MLASFLLVVLLLLVALFRLILAYRKIDELEKGNGWLIRAYESLDQGMQEQQEAYEQEYLTYDERIQTRDHSIEYMTLIVAELEAEVAEHRENCLPHVAPRECDG